MILNISFSDNGQWTFHNSFTSMMLKRVLLRQELKESLGHEIASPPFEEIASSLKGK